MSTIEISTNAMIQGHPEWLELRRWKITSSDAAVILGVNPWKTVGQLLEDKLRGTLIEKNAAMQRGSDLEEPARETFVMKSKIYVHPAVVISNEHAWMMTSLDGLSDCKKKAVEIKCPGEKTHRKAIKGQIPGYYYAQCQHHIATAQLDELYYFSFLDFFDTCTIRVHRDNQYIKRMIEAEQEFYNLLMDHKE